MSHRSSLNLLYLTISFPYLTCFLRSTPTKNKIINLMVRSAHWSAWMGWAQTSKLFLLSFTARVKGRECEEGEKKEEEEDEEEEDRGE